MKERLIVDYWRQLVGARELTTQQHGMGVEAELRSETMTFTDEEIAKVKLHREGILGASSAEDSHFDLSVWLEAYYFLPPIVSMIAYAKAVQRVAPGRLLLTDMNLSEHMIAALGLEVLSTLYNPFADADIKMTSQLLRRVRPSKLAESIADLG
jgi:hypothetical protein